MARVDLGIPQRKSVWLLRPLGLDTVRAQAELMEAESKRFYARAAGCSSDASIHQLLGDLAVEEKRHEEKAVQLQFQFVTAEVDKEEHQSRRRLFLLTNGATGPCGSHGRFRVHSGAAVRRRLGDEG